MTVPRREHKPPSLVLDHKYPGACWGRHMQSVPWRCEDPGAPNAKWHPAKCVVPAKCEPWREDNFSNLTMESEPDFLDVMAKKQTADSVIFEVSE